ncbi:MAG: transketolase [Sphingomonas sp.]|jgi:transketolase
MGTTSADLANAIRALSMDAVEAANSGHPGMPLGMADVATQLFTSHLKFDPANPKWPDRDRFVLSAGHGSMLIYSLLYLTGYARPTIDDICNFRQLGSPCAGHPENFELEGVECTTGPLGQGLAMAVGMAIAERHLNAEFGDALVDHKTWVIAGDGCLMEGINHEAIGIAGRLQLGRLNVLWDDNHITIDGAVSLSSSEDIPARYAATGWHVTACDGHDADDIARALAEAAADPRPSLVQCRTIIGKGAPNKQGTSKTHGAPLGSEEVAAARAAMGWTDPAFVIPEPILSAWRVTGSRGQAERASWLARHAAADTALTGEFDRRMAGALPAAWDSLKAHNAALVAAPQKVATRKASELALALAVPQVPELVGGSADLTGSNLTKVADMAAFSAENPAGRYLNYGIREFGMAAAMNGMALHGGIIPYGGTFLIFSDYARGAIRLSALQRARVIYVMTHDSIGVGEDGPTHQPIEQVQSFRIMPGLDVYRPCDTIETAECWAMAIETSDRPSLLALSRQNVPQLRDNADENMSAKGGYRLKAATAPRRVVLVGTGTEVSLALDVAVALEAQGIGADVVSMPSTGHFDRQPEAYRADILPADALIVSIEAGTSIGWERYTGTAGLRFGIDGFGASGPAGDLYKYFGLTVDAIVPQIIAKIEA